MFSVAKANSLMNKAKNNQLNSWLKLQQEIRKRAIHGYNFLYLTNANYLKLITLLQVNGYNVKYNIETDL